MKFVKLEYYNTYDTREESQYVIVNLHHVVTMHWNGSYTRLTTLDRLDPAIDKHIDVKETPGEIVRKLAE